MADESQPVRVRVAPSPTGSLHVGTARTALYNELFAKQHGGQFIIRIEDTDRERSLPEYEATILEGLKWLGLEWDEGPDCGGRCMYYRQSERASLHFVAIQQLLDAGKAVKVEGSNAIKLVVTPQEVVFEDLIRGKVTVHTDSFGGDFIIARDVNDPLYHLAVVLDDAAMGITHVIRGEDHLHNTAKHILIQRALKYEQPIYAHLPLLLDENRRKLSKRAGETNLLKYRDLGYLPEAMMNYLALLGWNPGTEQEYFSHQELVRVFSLQRVQKGGAIFSLQKLNSVNKYYIQSLSDHDLYGRVYAYFHGNPEAAQYDLTDDEYWQKALATEKSRVTTLHDFIEALDFFRLDWQATYEPALLVWKQSTPESAKELLGKALKKIEAIPDETFTTEYLQEHLMKWIDDEKLGRGDVLWPIRVALTGKQHSPGPFEVAGVLGKEKTIARITEGVNKL